MLMLIIGGFVVAVLVWFCLYSDAFYYSDFIYHPPED